MVDFHILLERLCIFQSSTGNNYHQCRGESRMGKRELQKNYTAQKIRLG